MKHHYCSPSFWQGVQRISALLVCLLFTFVFVVSPIKVKAEAFPIPPVWLPMNPYNAQGLEGNYVLLNDDQKEIVKEIIGAVNVVNLGFGQYVLINPISGIQNTRQFLRDYGGTFLETFWSQIMGTSRAMTDFVGSTIYKASTYETIEEYEADTAPSVASGSKKYFQISPELTVAFKNWYRANGGVEDWQNQAIQPSQIGNFTWNQLTIPAVSLPTYNEYLSNLGSPHVRANMSRNGQINFNEYFNMYAGGSFTSTYNVMFINTSNGYVYLMDSNGNVAPSSVNIDCVWYNNYAPYGVGPRQGSANARPTSYSISGFATVKDGVEYIFNNSSLFADAGTYDSVRLRLSLQDLIQHIFIGSSWATRQPWTMVEDLNIGSTPSEYIDNISDTGYVDINTLIGQIADEVINLRDVVEESVLVKDGTDAVPYADSLQVAIDKYINQPESGVVIPSDIFGGLTGANGPVSYLWYMTKPLVSYTGDLLGLLTLEGDGTFQFTGLGYIVIGVVTIGIIGGLVTKCLL